MACKEIGMEETHSCSPWRRSTKGGGRIRYANSNLVLRISPYPLDSLRNVPVWGLKLTEWFPSSPSQGGIWKGLSVQNMTVLPVSVSWKAGLCTCRSKNKLSWKEALISLIDEVLSDFSVGCHQMYSVYSQSEQFFDNITYCVCVCNALSWPHARSILNTGHVAKPSDQALGGKKAFLQSPLTLFLIHFSFREWPSFSAWVILCRT